MKKIFQGKCIAVMICLMLVSFLSDAQFGTVLSQKKISDTEGAFTGTLDDQDRFGSSQAVIGDLDGNGVLDFVVGAYPDDDGGTDRGAIWILFMESDGTVGSYQKISDTGGDFSGTLDDNDYFGISVDTIGDLNGDGVIDLVVGAPNDDDGGTNRGAAWILFLESDGTVDSYQKISDTDGDFTGTLADGDQLGRSVACLGDLDGDGVNDIAVGASRDDDGGTDRGAVWILLLETDGTVKSYQKISDTAGNFGGSLDDSDVFGISVGNIGDLNGDGVYDLIVGAFQDDDGGTNRGAAYILFLNSDGTVKSEQKISDTAGGFSGTLADSDYLGIAAKGVGDVDGDLVPDVMIGAYLDNDGGTDRGAVWLCFMNDDGTVKSEQKISDTAGNFSGGLDDSDNFGVTFVHVGDFYGDGKRVISVGAHMDDDGGTDHGAVHLLTMEMAAFAGAQAGYGTVLNEQKVSASAGGFSGTIGTGQGFGTSICAVGDLDGDGITDLVVGEPWDTDGGTARGAVWILFMNSDKTIKGYQKISDTAGDFSGTLDNNDLFGYKVAFLGDLDGAGGTAATIAVSAPYDDDGDTDVGAIWLLFLGTDGKVDAYQKISDTDGDFSGTIEAGDFFGASLEYLGDLDGEGESVAALAVGATGDDDGDTDVGAVWVLFLGTDGVVDAYQKISDTAGDFTGTIETGDSFGNSLGVLNDINNDGIVELLVGATGDDDGGASRGAVWILTLGTDGKVDGYQKISDTQGEFTGILEDGDAFGISAEGIGDVNNDGIEDVLIGAYFDDDGNASAGAVYILFMNSDGTVSSYQKLSELFGNLSSTLDSDDRFGISTSYIGDLDGNCRPEIVVGAYLDDDGLTDQGAIYILSLEQAVLASCSDDMYWIASSSGSYNTSGNWSPTSGGSAGYAIPGPANEIILDANGTGNLKINKNASMLGLEIQSGYTGTITAAHTIAVGDSGFVLNAGTWNASLSVLEVAGDFTIGSSATWNEDTSTVHFNGSNTQVITKNDTIDFYNLTTSSTGKKSFGNHVRVNGTLTLTNGELAMDDNTLYVYNSDQDAVNFSTGLISTSEGGKLLRRTAATDWYHFPLMTNKQYPDTFIVDILPSTSSVRRFEAAVTGTDQLVTTFNTGLMGAETTSIKVYMSNNDSIRFQYDTDANDSITAVRIYDEEEAAYTSLNPSMYTVGPKNTLTFHSMHSILSWYALKNLDQLENITSTCGNWEYTVTFGQNGAITSESVNYADLLGRPCQSQARNLTENTILTTQTIYDAYGRGSLQTLPAPTGATFNFATGFITDASGTAYSYLDYDTKNTLNNPAVVQSTMAGTVGHYYSSNSIEDYIPETSYPFVRTESLSSGSRSSTAGENYRMGNANNSESRQFMMVAPGEELEKIFGADSTWKVQMLANPLENKSISVAGGLPTGKSVSIDADGTEMISYMAGGNTVASCYSGLGGCGKHEVTHTMLFDGTRTIDIHVPAAKVDSVKLPLPAYENASLGFSTVHTDSITYTITDVETNYVLEASTDFTIGGDRYIDFTATNGYSSGTHFLRITFDYTATFYDLKNGVDTPDARVTQRLDYTDWSVNYYDIAGNLRKSVSPKGINCLDPGTISMATTFDYSSLGQLIATQSPDQGLSEMMYDSEGKLRFSQNADQAAGDRFSYIDYDDHARVVESGEYTTPTSGTGHYFQNYYDDYSAPGGCTCTSTDNQLETSGGLDDTYTDFVHTSQYDTINTVINFIPDDYTYIDDYDQTYTAGAVTKTSNEETDTWYSYDHLGRVRWVVQRLRDSDYTAERTATDQQVMTMDYTYNLTGQVTDVEYNKNVPWEALTHNYTYDADFRLSNVTIDTDNLTAEQIAAYQYYLTGALKRKELGDNLQGLDYIYTINGQLKSLNHPSLDQTKDPGRDGDTGSDFDRDVFGMSIDYHSNDYTRTGSEITSSSSTGHYNGLIDAVRWNTLYEWDILKSGTSDETLVASSDEEIMYRYHYNAFNWLDSARFGVYNTTGPAFTISDAYKLWGDGDNTAITYDDNGNIEKLKRNGYSGGDPGGLLMDEFNYTYTSNTNQLASILDDATTSYTNDFDAATSQTFTYNTIGQLTASTAEGVTGVTYTPGGKVASVTFTNGDVAYYFYNDRGHKYKTQLDPNGGNDVFTWYTTDVSGNIMGIYTFTEGGDSIELNEQPIYADGRIGILHTKEDSVIYEITDHQGNVRVAFTEQNDTTHIVAWTDFYPFGSPMPGRYENSNDYRYGFNGQESVVEMKGSAGSHYTAPFWEYDSRVGRRWNQDPKPNPSISNYATFSNNPIWFSDELGDTVKVTHRLGFLGLGKKETLTYEGGSLFNKDGTAYEGKVKGFLKKSQNALNAIRSSREGGELLEELESSSNVFTLVKSDKTEFQESDRFKAYANQFSTDPSAAAAYSYEQSQGRDFTGGSGGTIHWNPGGALLFEVGGKQANRPFVNLAHELFHGLDANRGLLDSRAHLGIARSEWQATYRENMLRLQMNLPLRTHYRSQQTGTSGPVTPLPPYLLTPSGGPTLPSWYKR